jgi:TonB family protein
MFGIVLASLIAAAGEPAYLASCPASDVRVVATSAPVVSDNIHPTNRRARFLLDIGSDGQLRRSALVESSGDAVFDAAALDAAKRFRFAPPTQGCISTSAVVPEEFNVSLLALARPSGGAGSPGPFVLPSTPPEAAVAICPAAPFVRLTGLDVPDQRQAPGTADVDVGLDASARVTSVKLAKSSGNPKTDAAATAAAKDGQYAYTLPPGCKPQATTYRLELTYH